MKNLQLGKVLMTAGIASYIDEANFQLGGGMMTKCWICGASELQVPNHKIKFTGKYCGKRRQKTIRVCDCCSGWLSVNDIEEKVKEEYCWDDPEQ